MPPPSLAILDATSMMFRFTLNLRRQVEDVQFNSVSAQLGEDEHEDESAVFRYQESPDSTEFFLPYIWSVIYTTQIVPFFPAEMQETLAATEEISLPSAAAAEELFGLPETFSSPPAAQNSLLPGSL